MQPATQAWWFAAGRLLATVLVGLRRRLAVRQRLGRAGRARSRCTWPGCSPTCSGSSGGCATAATPIRPDVGGVWGEIIAQIVRLHRRKRFHKQRFVQLMRQLQRSTAALPDGVVILNAQREIVWFNRMAARLLNLRRTADLGHAHREPAARAGVRALPGRRRLRQPDRHPHQRPARTATCRCRSRRMATGSCCCWCAMSPGRCAWRRCGGTSSPMPRTSCARRSR